MRAVLLLFLVLLSLPAAAAERSIAPLDVRSGAPPVHFLASSMDTFCLGVWDFDDGVGGPDPQGWTTHDPYGEQDTYFHVDDFAGLGGLYAPLEGTKSMWCGLRENCTYAVPPGYGRSWRQYFETTTGFATSGDVTVSYIVRYDVEPNYDFVYLDYLSKTGTWRNLTSHNGQAQSFESHTIPGDSLDGTAKIRFFFQSDGAFDDESGLWPTDGAVVIDSLRVSDATGLVDYQDFETEALNAITTADGDWYAHAEPPFGNYGGLVDGSTVLQEDSLVTNNTWFWAFFNGSTDTYACGGHPGQAALPLGDDTDSNDVVDFIHNEARSPWIPFNEDVDGHPVPWQSQTLLLEFDVYRDLPLANGLYYRYTVRFLVDGCPTIWRLTSFFYSDAKDWYRHVADISSWIEVDATAVQVALRADDWCSFYCGQSTQGDCHSHAPLFDNVKVSRVRELVSDTGAGPELATRLEQNHPNPFNPATTIRYTIANDGPVFLAVYDVAGRLIRTLVNESQNASTYTVEWNGRDDRGLEAATGVYFYRLDAGGASETRKMTLLK